jgi:hypothetical protein|tara:strand:- start:3932 stop:4108 length:177 start_codon:yes stop_codon:yes gene_type:complete
MKTIISLGNGMTLEIKDLGEPRSNQKSVSVDMMDAYGKKIGGGWTDGDEFKRLGKVMK